MFKRLVGLSWSTPLLSAGMSFGAGREAQEDADALLARRLQVPPGIRSPSLPPSGPQEEEDMRARQAQTAAPPPRPSYLGPAYPPYLGLDHRPPLPQVRPTSIQHIRLQVEDKSIATAVVVGGGMQGTGPLTFAFAQCHLHHDECTVCIHHFIV